MPLYAIDCRQQLQNLEEQAILILMVTTGSVHDLI